MKEGQKLIAISKCIAYDWGGSAITVGEHYQILTVLPEKFSVIGDFGDEYFFLNSEKDKYFKDSEEQP